MSERLRLGAMAGLATAMAFMEAATVLYLRTLIDRVEPHQPDPLPLCAGFGTIELLREASTLVLIAAAATLAGTTWRRRLGHALFAFGLWDALYYAFLGLMGPWPRSIWDWDILFLIPLPWWGPVVAPVSIAVLMIVTGAWIAIPTRGVERWPSRTAWRIASIGIVIALAVFMADALRALPGGAEEVRSVLPVSFRWGWFVVSLVLLAVPAGDLAARARRQSSGVPAGEAPRHGVTLR